MGTHGLRHCTNTFSTTEYTLGNVGIARKQVESEIRGKILGYTGVTGLQTSEVTIILRNRPKGKKGIRVKQNTTKLKNKHILKT